MFRSLFIIMIVILLSACMEKKEQNSNSVSMSMKCGAGKCGANMFDGSSALAKKQKNILSQMDDNDRRKDCVIGAKTTKDVYNCVRDDSGKMRLKCGVSNEVNTMPTKETKMKCGAGKCGVNKCGSI
jgi:hypothetical protein